jgi:uncharacterized protein YjbI with pentapeptide repeats
MSVANCRGNARTKRKHRNLLTRGRPRRLLSWKVRTAQQTRQSDLMPYLFRERERPASWSDFRPAPLHPYLLPFTYTNWAGEWMAYILGKWSIFEVLDYVGSFSILIAVIFYFADSGNRLKMKHYQAWQVINTAQGKGGSGGRIDALQELNDDGVSLVGVDVSGSYLRGITLVRADLRRGKFDSADLRNAVLRKSVLASSTLLGTNLRDSDCDMTDLTDADLSDADLPGATLRGADVQDATLDRANLRETDLANLRDWQTIASMNLCNIHGVRNAPAGFVDFAMSRGAVDLADDNRFYALLRDAASTQPLVSQPSPIRAAHDRAATEPAKIKSTTTGSSSGALPRAAD